VALGVDLGAFCDEAELNRRRQQHVEIRELERLGILAQRVHIALRHPGPHVDSLQAESLLVQDKERERGLHLRGHDDLNLRRVARRRRGHEKGGGLQSSSGRGNQQAPLICADGHDNYRKPGLGQNNHSQSRIASLVELDCGADERGNVVRHCELRT
jgi:hypothetical protein